MSTMRPAELHIPPVSVSALAVLRGQHITVFLGNGPGDVIGQVELHVTWDGKARVVLSKETKIEVTTFEAVYG